MNNNISQYRNLLISTDLKAQEEFDKIILTLSGGSLGITFTFIQEIIGDKPVMNFSLMFFAWIAWISSVTMVLISYYMSHLALRKATKQLDEQKIYLEHPGGYYDTITEVCNICSAVLFLVGVILAIIFANNNL